MTCLGLDLSVILAEVDCLLDEIIQFDGNAFSNFYGFFPNIIAEIAIWNAERCNFAKKNEWEES